MSVACRDGAILKDDCLPEGGRGRDCLALASGGAYSVDSAGTPSIRDGIGAGDFIKDS